MSADITILNEVGVDPGIDHMLAMQCFDEIKYIICVIEIISLSFVY